MAAPREEELQELYDEVWAEFSEEIAPSAPPVSSTSSTGDKELESLYSAYGDDNGRNQPPGYDRQPRVSSSESYASAGPSAGSRALPNIVDSPTQGRGPRPLPRPPGAAAAVSPSTYSMPEPDPFSEPQPTGRTLDSTSYTDSTDLRRKVTANSINRQLPTAPSPSMNGSHGSPSYQSSSSGRSDLFSFSDTPDLSLGWNSSPNTTLSGGDSHPSSPASVSRKVSTRPSGASAPVNPGYGGMYDLRESTTPTSSTSPAYTNGATGNGYPVDKKVSPSSRRPSEDMVMLRPSTGSRQAPDARAPAYENQSRPIGHSTSTGSVSSYANGTPERRPSATPSAISGSYLDPNSTSLDRGNSTGSYRSTASDGLAYLRDEAYSSHPEPLGGYHNAQHGHSDHQQNAYGPESSNSRLPLDAEKRDLAIRGKGPLELHEEEDDEDEYWEEEEEEDRFVNFSLLSHIAVRLRDKVPRGTHVKGSIPYPRAFTGKDIVSTIQSQIQRELLIDHGVSTSDRRAALQVARSLQSQLFFYEVEWGGRTLQDGVEDVYMFLDDQEGGSDSPPEREELPTGVITMLTKCYTPSCGEGTPCYSYSCPRRGNTLIGLAAGPVEVEAGKRGGWETLVDKAVINSLPESEISRQTIIHTVISKEEQYIQDLDTVESAFIKPLRIANPPVIQPHKLDEFIEDVFGNILDLRECNRRLLEVMYVRQREQAPVIQRIGDVFLGAAAEFRLAYPIYVGHLPAAEKRMKDEIESNPQFRLFLEQCSRESARHGEALRLDLKHFLNRPSEHLQKYPVLLEAIMSETAEGNPDADFLAEAIQAIKNLQSVAQLRTFQTAMGKGPTGKWEWHDLVSKELREGLPKGEAKRQSIIFELIKGEMAYVKDLESIEIMYIRPLRSTNPPIIARERLDTFIQEVYHNFAELHAHHRRLCDVLHEIQREEHPLIRSVTAAILDAALNFRDAYLEYIPNYPIAAYRIDSETATNPLFKAFVDQCIRHADAHRLDMKTFINRPIPRLLRYELLLKGVLEDTPAGHEDLDTIPQVLEIIKSLGKESEPGVKSAEQKVDLWRYNSNLIFKPGDFIDMDLLDENRSLIHTGKLLRQPETGIEWNGWSELYVLLFDNYLVMTKARDRDGIMKYHVNRRPIPLDLLTLANFTDPAAQRNTGILRGLQANKVHNNPNPTAMTSPDSAGDSKFVYPCTFHHSGRVGGLYTLYAESQVARTEWKAKLEEAIGLRKVVQESNKVFEIETLSTDTFLVPSMSAGATTPSWSHENSFTGKVTCSVPFNTADGRGLVAVGCAEGVWIGFRHDSRSMRRVLHLKMVTQCAMLEDFGIFLVLADKSLFAYHIEALVPSSPQTAHTSQTPQKLNGTKDVHFFSVGTLGGRTLVIYMKKKGLDSVFRVLEPVVGKINEKTKAPVSLGSRLGLRPQRSDWFRIYRDFFLPSESFDLIFLKAKIAILCTKGFEIMDLTDFKSVTIPQRDDPRLEKLAKRCESCKPMGMFRSNEDEFLLCYDEFGLYVDKHGDPSRPSGTIEWECTADRVALHHPYVLLFDSRFIEIRHVETGRLAQIITGNDIRCIWDGRGVSNQTIAQLPHGHDQEAKVHAVMNAPEPVYQPGGGMRQSRAIAQHVFELIPTIPLYLPEPLTSPSTSTYFPQSASPPQSPQMRNSSSWRS